MRTRRVLVRGAVVALAAAFLLASPPPAVHGASLREATGSTTATATSATDPVTLQGDGSYDVAGELKSWENDLYGSSGALTVNYMPGGGYAGRQDLYAGNADFAISGVAPTAAELAKLKGGASSLIAAPVLASGLGALVLPPILPDGTDGFAEYDYDANLNLTKVPYKGPINLPEQSLASMLISARQDGGTWPDPANIAAFGLPPDNQNDPDGGANEFEPDPQDTVPIAYLQDEASEQDYYAQQLAAQASPTAWATVTGGQPYTITDQLPSNLDSVKTVQGIDSTFSALAPQYLPTFNDSSGIAGGVIAAEPPSALVRLRQANPTSTTAPLIQWVAAENHKGQYVTPSPASIDAAIDAGGATPFYALDNDVDGGYPLTYVDDIYVPASGLSIDKTEALATLIRYLATDGQSYTTANNDGALSPALVDQALAAANQVVTSNCTAAGGVVVTNASPGRYAPNTPLMKKIGSMLHCGATAADTLATSPATPSSASALASTGSGYTPLASDDLSTSAEAATAAGSSLAAAGGGGKAQTPGKTARLRRDRSDLGAISLADLPLQLPWSGVPAYDRLGALLLGAGIFLAGRRVVRWLIRLCQP